MIQKRFYQAPEAELLLVKFEKNILSDPMEGGEWDDPFGNSSSNPNSAPKNGTWHWMNKE